MDDSLHNAKATAIARQSRSPGFREVLELLEKFAEQARNDAFNCDDDSKAIRLLHEGRGATSLVNKFKSEIALIETGVMERNEY